MYDFRLLLYMYTSLVVAESADMTRCKVYCFRVDRIEQDVIMTHAALGPAEPSQNGLV